MGWEKFPTIAQRKLEKNSESQTTVYADGKGMEKLLQSEQKEDNAGTTLVPSFPQQTLNQEGIFVTPPHPRRKIYKDKLSFLELDSLTTKLSRILDQASTLKEKDLRPFWDTHLEEKYKNWWLPTKSDYSGSDLNCSGKSFNSIREKSWYSTKRKINPSKQNSVRTSFPLLPSLPLESTVSEVTKTGVVPVTQKVATKGKASVGGVKTLRIRLFPQQEEKWIQAVHSQSRWFYNASLNIVLNHYKNDLKKLWKVNETTIRDLVKRYRFVTENCTLSNGELVQFQEFLLDEEYSGWPTFGKEKIIHNRIPRGAAIQFARNLNSCLSNYRNGNISKFQLRYRSQKKDSQTTFFEDAGFPKKLLEINSKYCYTTKIGGRNKRTYVSFKDIFNQDPSKSGFVLEYDILTNKHYILYTVPVNWYPSNDRRNENQISVGDRKGIVSCDPGVRTFLTSYSTEEVVKMGDGANRILFQLLHRIDKWINKPEKMKKILKLRRRIKNLVKELHWKTGNYLVRHHGIIILPHFRVSELLRGKKLAKVVKRQLLTLSFFSFKDKLQYLTRKWNRKLLLVEEDFTSKTCGNCGVLNSKLGGSEVFSCSKCKILLDRDENGARNILLKNLVPLL